MATRFPIHIYHLYQVYEQQLVAKLLSSSQLLNRAHRQIRRQIRRYGVTELN
jgi:hypothetical protein